jgi:hypothetical protein
MQLAAIYRINNLILEGAMLLYDLPTLLEAAWPQEWAENVFGQPRFQQWLQSLGIQGTVGHPMAGGVGRAYPVGSDFIIKFTTDTKEAQAAAALKGHSSPHAADIYDVRRLFSYDNPDNPNTRKHLYAIAMQRLNTGVGKKMRIAGNAVYDYLDHNAGFIEDPDAVVRLIMTRFLDKKYRTDPAITALVRKVIHALYKLQEQTGVLSQDPHGSNLAFKGREPAFFDFGRSSMNYDHPRMAGTRVTSL